MMQNKWFKTALVALIGAMIISFALLNMQNSAESTYQSPRAISGSSIGGGFSLIDEDGGVFTDQDLKRPYRLIYFGFTYCPAICPTELAKTVKAFNQLPVEIQESIDLVFITIDPERDTPEVMKQYTDMFHPRLIGLSGAQDQIEAVLSQYKVYAAKVQDDTMSDYTMDHSSYIYLFNNDNQLRAMYRMSDEAPFIADDLFNLLK